MVLNNLTRLFFKLKIKKMLFEKNKLSVFFVPQCEAKARSVFYLCDIFGFGIRIMNF